MSNFDMMEALQALAAERGITAEALMRGADKRARALGEKRKRREKSAREGEKRLERGQRTKNNKICANDFDPT